MLSVEKSKGPSTGRKSNMSVLGFNDEERVCGAPNEIFPLFIVATMANHDVSLILEYRVGGALTILCMRSYLRSWD
jgi:hypothetical protein